MVAEVVAEVASSVWVCKKTDTILYTCKFERISFKENLANIKKNLRKIEKYQEKPFTSNLREIERNIG